MVVVVRRLSVCAHHYSSDIGKDGFWCGRSIAEGLKNNLKMRPDDIMIVLTEVRKENWSFAHGIAQYAWEPDYLHETIIILKMRQGEREYYKSCYQR